MRFSISTLTIQTAFTLLATTTSATYTIEDDYTPSSFASMFDFFTDNDPTNGYVNYISQDAAQNAGLYSVQNGTVHMGVDSTNTATGRGRDSIRVSSKKSYNHGLIILDLAHMPAGACGTWPAFWLVGPNWPTSGEIDIIEGVNSATTNSMTLHTDTGCSITSTGAFSGNLKTVNCDVNAAGQATNAGCSIDTSVTQSYGAGFNANGGGVYATQWTSEAISIWFFARNAIPADITSGNPNPANWGLPMAQFAGGCSIDEHIVNQQIVFDVTFCGDWAGQVWSTDSTCAPKAATCQAYVQNSPSAFTDTYWSINSLKVYQDNGAAAPSAPGASTTLTTTTPTATQTIPAGSLAPAPSSGGTSTTTMFSTTTVTTTNLPTTFATQTYPNTYAPAASHTWSLSATPAASSPGGDWGNWNQGQGNWGGNGGGNGDGWGGRGNGHWGRR